MSGTQENPARKQRLQLPMLQGMAMALVCLFGAGQSLAEPVYAVAETQLLESADEKRSDFLVPLGTLKESRDGRPAPERSLRVAGIAHREVFQLASSTNLKLVLPVLLERVGTTHAGLAPLYQCEGRECGLSGLWANDILGEPILLGADRSQFVRVFGRAGEPLLVIVYATERANRRSHYLVERIDLSEPLVIASDSQVSSASASADRLRWILPVDRVTKRKQERIDQVRLKLALQPVIDQLGKASALHWAVVSHDCEGASSAFVRSQAVLDEVMPMLKVVPGKQFHSVNSGNMAPPDCQTRRLLEIVELAP